VGEINFGAPENEIKFLKKLLKLDVFVEGGSYTGGTSKKMSKTFKKVYTIEKSDVMYGVAKKSLEGIGNITLLKGDTREHLSSIIESNDNMIFWLDAHWSGGDTYGKTDECPLVEELQIIFKNMMNCVVLIDDARLFLAPPPCPHNYQNWPSLTDISSVIPHDWDMVEFEDVLYLFKKSISDDFKPFLQNLVTNKYNKKKSLWQVLISKLGG
jgi:hypothetical protein